MHSPCSAERRRGIGAAGIGLLLAAALAGSLAALVAALALAEHAAARKSRRESSDTERDLERMNDDLLHDVPLFFLSLPFGTLLVPTSRSVPQFLPSAHIMNYFRPCRLF